jgi:DNA-binding NtrC family response regulator
VRAGAFDFIPKPIDLNLLLASIKTALGANSAVATEEAEQLQPRTITKRRATGVQEIIGRSPKIMHVKGLIDRVAPSDARVLITGENGTGKELVARWLHEKSRRAASAFVEINCAAIPSELIESELFGHEKGAFTSADKQRKGKFEQATGGTLFMDEIGDMSLSAQAKVLRALQEGRISRVGSDKDITVDVRVVAATNKNLREEIAGGRFREDLYHRISVIIINVPPLRDRADDIPLLIDHFIDHVCDDYGITRKNISGEGIEILKTMPWTGNIRELRNVVERLIILADDQISVEEVESYVSEFL